MKNREGLTQLDRIENALGELLNSCNSGTSMVKSAMKPEASPNLENAKECNVPLSFEGDETMANRVRLRVCVGYNDDMSPVIKSITANSELELADRIVRAVLSSERRKEFVKESDSKEQKKPEKPLLPTFQEYAEEWLKLYKEGKLKPTTMGDYRMVLNAHLYPVWGNKRLDEITTRGIQEFLNSKKDKARKTIQDMIMLLRVILESALRDQLIDVNPASDRRLVNPSNRKTVREALPVEEVQDIIANLGKLETMDQRYMALAIYTGMRRGEIIGLRWEDVDLDANVLRVRRNVTYPKGDNRPCIGTPKTESGYRDVPIMSALMEYLKPFGKPDAYVVGDDTKPITFSIHRRMMERIRRTIDLHGACSHVFRHSFATMLNDAGASVKTIQSIIGQKDFKTTADRYCHPRDNRKQEAVEGVDKLLCS